VKRWLHRVLVLAATLIVLKFLVPSIERRLVFFPFSGEDANPATVGIPYERVSITTSDGERLALWQLEPQSPVADVVYFHGNGGNLSVWLPVFMALHRMHLRVLAVDYRGYGLSTGTPSEEGLLRDAEAVVEYAQQHRTPARPLVYWGRSLGGAVAAAATRVARPDGLILESTFPDKASVIRRQPVLRALNVFATYRFPTLEWLHGFDRPVLVMHGDRDAVVPYRLGEELFERLQSPKSFVTLRGADHNDPFDITNREYWGPVLAFIEGLPRRPE
jgi:pimeloyl-ACP methyl ester carboxylesterase